MKMNCLEMGKEKLLQLGDDGNRLDYQGPQTEDDKHDDLLDVEFITSREFWIKVKSGLHQSKVSKWWIDIMCTFKWFVAAKII